ncbi:hypothetical protein Bca4012_084301 [Brassica carinata]
MKKMKKHCDMLQFICDAEHRIPSLCPCGGQIVDEVSTNRTDKDFLPGQRYFTCNAYKVIVQLCETCRMMGSTSVNHGFSEFRKRFAP